MLWASGGSEAVQEAVACLPWRRQAPMTFAGAEWALAGELNSVAYRVPAVRRVLGCVRTSIQSCAFVPSSGLAETWPGVSSVGVLSAAPWKWLETPGRPGADHAALPAAAQARACPAHDSWSSSWTRTPPAVFAPT